MVHFLEIKKTIYHFPNQPIPHALEKISHFVLHHGSKFDVKMRREPVAGLQVVQELFGCRAPQGVGLHLLTEKLLLAQQLLCASVIIDSTRPVMAHEDVNGHLDLYGKRLGQKIKLLFVTNVFIINR